MIGLKDSGPAPPSAPPPNRLREKSAQAIEYYNNNLQRVRANSGLSRSSYNDNHGLYKQNKPKNDIYRSNSSLELAENQIKTCNNGGNILKREYGSYGSIDHIPTGDSFFAMLQEYKPAVLDTIVTEQRSPGPSDYLRNQEITGEDFNSNNTNQNSPKLKNKLTRFWGPQNKNSTNQIKAVKTMDDALTMTDVNVIICEPEDIARRRAFTHYDCQSLTTNLSHTIRLRRNLLAKRRNTTTGASAASMLSSSTSSDGEVDDSGDGLSNELVESCPFFRNEIGGEFERVVSLTRLNGGVGRGGKPPRPFHRPPLAYGVAILEYPPGETHWRHSTCPYQKLPRPIESVDQGALYYRKHFFGLEHQNWFGTDEQLGPIAISIRRERVLHGESVGLVQHQYRLVIRTSELNTLRGAILEDSIPNIKASSSSSRAVCTKEVLEHVAPEVQLSSLRLGVPGEQTEQQLLKLDEQGLTNNYKVGVMYCKAQQASEEEMYNNEEAGPAFQEFLETIGKTVRLKDFDKYRAGLDNKSDSTGLYSVYAQYQECEIMFHVSTMLPFTPNNRQQLLRKRHIGNDIVTIVFQEPGALPFTPKGIRSQFQHVFIIVRAINPCTENTHYKISVSRSKDVQVFGPPIKDGAVFAKGKSFADFLLAKVVNAENAAHRSEKFVTMATRTRQEYLKDLVTNFSTTTPVDTGQKFSIFSKKKEKIRLRFIPDICQRGAILWQVILEDCGQSQQVDCLLGVSSDSLVLLEEHNKQIVFVAPCRSILGWSTQSSNGLRIYHHQGECVNIYMRDVNCDRDELMEVVERLKAVSQGVPVKELTLKRNIMGQLGFHVQPDGIVTLVESQGQAWQGGLRQNSRLVEICKVAVSTLTYDSMVDLLKTSSCVTLTVIPPLQDGSPRKGCALQNCRYNEGNYENDYDSSNSDENKPRKAPHGQRAVPGNHRIYDRSFSPPRSSNSSGYGTGSSSKSYVGNTVDPQTTDDRWFELLQETFDRESGEKLTGNSVGTRMVSNRVNEYNTKYLTPSKASSNYQLTHNHFRSPQHQKLHSTHSLPLSQINYASLQPSTEIDITFEPSNESKNVKIAKNANYEVLGGQNYLEGGYEGAKNIYEASKNNFEAPQKNYEQLKGYENTKNFEVGKSNYDMTKSNFEPSKSNYESVKTAYEASKSNYEGLKGSKNNYEVLKSNFYESNKIDNNAKTYETSKSQDMTSKNYESPSKNYESTSKNYESPSKSCSLLKNQYELSNYESYESKTGKNNYDSVKKMEGIYEPLKKSKSHSKSSNLDALLEKNNYDSIKTSYESVKNAFDLSKMNFDLPKSSKNYESHSAESTLRRTGSEDELLMNSRKNKNLGSVSGGNSRNQSPRDPKLKAGVLNRSNRNSANLSTNFQEELMRLINPDDTLDQKEIANEQPEVILTLARPATVISNTSSTSSPLQNEFKSSDRSLKSVIGRNDVLPLPEDMDWSSLVDTATRAMQQVSDDNISNDSIEVWNDNAKSSSDNLCSVSSSMSVPELQGHFGEAMSRETRRRLSLEQEVRRLKEENRKLQEEKRQLQDQVHVTSSQLRKFTEWFFKNVQRQ